MKKKKIIKNQTLEIEELKQNIHDDFKTHEKARQQLDYYKRLNKNSTAAFEKASTLLGDSERECEGLKVLLFDMPIRGEQKIHLDKEPETKSVWIAQDKKSLVLYGVFSTKEMADKYRVYTRSVVVRELEVI